MYTIGASHDLLSGSGSFTVSAPAGLLATVLGTGPSVGRQEGTPTVLHRFGRLTPGDTYGYYPAVQLVNFQQIILPLPAGITFVGYDLGVGCGLKVQELVGAAAGNSALQPWDRSPATINRAVGGTSGPTGGGWVTLWSYTVPAGKKFWLTGGMCSVTRNASASVLGQTYMLLRVNGSNSIYLPFSDNVVTHRVVTDLPGGLVLLPGGTVESWWLSSDTGGNQTLESVMNGYEFSA